MRHGYSTRNLLKSGSVFRTPINGTSFAWAYDTVMYRVIQCTAGVDNFGVLDVGAGNAISCFAILNSNIATLSGARMELYANNDPTFSSGTIIAKALTTFSNTGGRLDHVVVFPAVTARYWKPVWVWNGGSFSMTFGELWLGSLTTLPRAVGQSHNGRASMYKSIKVTTMSGDERGHSVAGPITRRAVSVPDMSDTDRDAWQTFFDDCRGGTRPTLWVENVNQVQTAASAAEQECLYGKLEQQLLADTESEPGRHEPAGRLSIRSFSRGVGA